MILNIAKENAVERKQNSEIKRNQRWGGCSNSIDMDKVGKGQEA